MPTKKKAKPEIKVVFDTNVLFTQIASDLVRAEVRQLIEGSSKHTDLKLSWYLPDIVVSERRYQMQRKAFELLPNTQKLETLLGHKLNINEEVLTHRVDEAINKQIQGLGIKTIDLDTKIVDWQQIIKRAVYRHPPFQPGDKEKGFRDALIAQSFIQLLENSPSTPTVCKLAIVTEDKLLADYILEMSKESKNVRVLSSLNELENLINTLVSQVTEEFVAEVSKTAQSLFFEKETATSLYAKENIRAQIKEKYAEELKAVPSQGMIRENGTWFIYPPVFIKKEKQRIFWSSSIKVKAKLYKYINKYQSQQAPVSGLQISTYEPTISTGLQIPSSASDQPGIAKSLAEGLLGLIPEKVEAGNGETSFDVLWTVTVSAAKKLTHPNIESISCVGSSWGEG